MSIHVDWRYCYNSNFKNWYWGTLTNITAVAVMFSMVLYEKAYCSAPIDFNKSLGIDKIKLNKIKIVYLFSLVYFDPRLWYFLDAFVEK